MSTAAGAAEGLAPAGDLAQFISRFVPLHKDGSAELRGRCPFCETGTDNSLAVGTGWRTWCCNAHEIHLGDAPGFYACWTNTSRDDAIAKLGNGAGLPEAQPIMQVPLRKLPFWGWRYLDKPLLRDAPVWVHELSGAVIVWRELAPERVHLGLIAGRSWDDLAIVAGRRCVLVPEDNASSRARMAGLAACLYHERHAQVMCFDAGGELPPVGEDSLKWAKARSEPYPKPNAAPQDNQADDSPVRSSPLTGPSSGPLPNTSGPAGAAPLTGEELDQVLDAAAFPLEFIAAKVKEAKARVLDSKVAAPSAIAQPAKPALAVVDGNRVRAPRKREADAEDDPLPAFSEFALARAFADGPGKDWRYTAAWAEWASWSGARWVPDEVKRITWVLRECCTAMMQANLADSTPPQRMRLTTLKTVNAVMALAGSDPTIATAVAEWDADPMLLGTPAGVVDLSTGALIPATQAQMISRSTCVAPVAGEHPWWDRVLERAGAGMAEFLQLWCGYMLTGDTKEERFLFIHGPGGGGKSKFLLVLSEILGDYRRTTKMESFTAQPRQEHSEEIARLAGARLVIATETDEGSRWNEARIKALTGRDAIAARHMHKSTFEFKPQFKLVFVGNHRPALRSVGEEMRRRIDLIEWGATIPEAERILDLPDRLRTEYPAILAWMIEGCLAWQRSGLGRPESVALSVADYIQGEDTLGSWLDSCAETARDKRVRSGEAYRSFKRWAEAAGEFVPSQKRFTQRLKDRGFETIKSGERYFVGFALKPAEDADSYMPPEYPDGR
jgi:putative DNA primase/helicase